VSLIRLLLPAVVVVAVLPTLPAGAQTAPSTDYRQVVDITFPTERSARFSAGYDDPRSGGRVHKATDLMAPRMTRLYAAVDGTVCSINGLTEPAPSWGMALTVCGVDGRQYRYLHVNNDTPGTDDGKGGPEHAYAPGIRKGKAVKRGQWLGWVGDSGNAETTAPHLHFEIGDSRVVDPYGDNRIDPYPSLRAALARGDVSTDTSVRLDPVGRAAGQDRIGTALALSASRASADTVVLAPATTFQEPVVAGPLAAALDAPLLTTWPDRLDPRVAERLVRLGATKAVLVGLSDAVAAGLPAGLAVERLGGSDPYATSAAVAERVWSELGQGAAADVDLPDEVVSPAGRLLVGRADRSGGAPLHGQRVDGPSHVWLQLADGVAVESVSFHLDDAEARRAPLRTEALAPHDLGGTGDDGRSRPVDLSQLGGGLHSVTAVARLAGGATARTTAWVVVPGGDAADRTAVVTLGGHPVTDRSWPDGVTASYLGAAVSAPVLLVEPSGLRPVVAPQLQGVDRVLVVGGPAAVPTAVSDAVDALAGTVTRLAGATRYSTALAVDDHVLGRRSPQQVYAATAHGWADAISAGPAAAAAGAPLVLVDGAAGPSDSETGLWLNGRWDSLVAGTVVGGPAVVGDAALDRLSRRIT
jgi:putative cell wall-binding protein